MSVCVLRESRSHSTTAIHRTIYRFRDISKFEVSAYISRGVTRFDMRIRMALWRANKYDNVATNKFVERVATCHAIPARLGELSEIITSLRASALRVAASRICRRVQHDNSVKRSWKLLRIDGSTFRQIKIIGTDNHVEPIFRVANFITGLQCVRFNNGKLSSLQP